MRIAYFGFWRWLKPLSPRASFGFQHSIARPLGGFTSSSRQSSRTLSCCTKVPPPEPCLVGEPLLGNSGRTYKVEQILVDRRDPLRCVYRASCEGEDFIVKNAVVSYEGDFEYPQKLQAGLSGCQNLRTMVDTVPNLKLYVYPFMSGDLLQLSQKPLLEEQRRHILKSVLTGLAALHERGIFHTDIKPNNILINYDEQPDGSVTIQDVKLSDLEDAVLLEPDMAIKGAVLGNKLWRSPESWTGATQEHPSDVFSFGIVAIYVIEDRMAFYNGLSDEQVNGTNAWWHILRRHISPFGTDVESFLGLVRHVCGEETGLWFDRLEDLINSFSEEEPRGPFARWMWLDEEFRDLVGKMTNLNPARRITAREALAHRWFTRTSD
ncbi:kinase-like domain-containing protein [Diaporthe sp. PMI_573]|nr:kinase-like domain-containing protein [Diaporthaceae sp. PMI_573]